MQSARENVGVLIEAWKIMAGRFPAATITQADGVASMFANIVLPFLNVSAPDRPLLDVASFRAALAVARQRAKACPHGSLLALCEPWVPADWESICKDEGFAMALNMTGMEAIELLPRRRAPAPVAPAIEFRRVAGDATARDLAMVNAQAYGMPSEMFECICNMHLWHDDTWGFVAYAGGRAVSTAAALPVAGTMYIALVATLPDAQGHGYAEAVMRHAIEQAQPAMGGRKMTLHASDMGRPLYTSMGFAPGGRVMLLMPAGGPSDGH